MPADVAKVAAGGGAEGRLVGWGRAIIAARSLAALIYFLLLSLLYVYL
jgi:hypothetical protein